SGNLLAISCQAFSHNSLGFKIVKVLLNRTEWHWYQLAGASYQYTVDEVSKLCEEYIIPLFAGFL
ncbi:hypothetical protein Q604_UNBC13073G0001, partial [human gut metagenome]